MRSYWICRGLIAEARRIAHEYFESEIDTITGVPELAMVMARSSFIAHSLQTGYEPHLVARVADHVFDHYIDASYVSNHSLTAA